MESDTHDMFKWILIALAVLVLFFFIGNRTISDSSSSDPVLTIDEVELDKEVYTLEDTILYKMKYTLNDPTLAGKVIVPDPLIELKDEHGNTISAISLGFGQDTDLQAGTHTLETEFVLNAQPRNAIGMDTIMPYEKIVAGSYALDVDWWIFEDESAFRQGKKLFEAGGIDIPFHIRSIEPLTIDKVSIDRDTYRVGETIHYSMVYTLNREDLAGKVIVPDPLLELKDEHGNTVSAISLGFGRDTDLQPGTHSLELDFVVQAQPRNAIGMDKVMSYEELVSGNYALDVDWWIFEDESAFRQGKKLFEAGGIDQPLRIV